MNAVTFSKRNHMRYRLLSVALLFSVLAYGQQTILWKVSHPASPNTSYLLGTYHLFGNSFVDSFPVIREKIGACSIVITETEINRAAAAAYYNARPASDTLTSVLSQEDMDLLRNIFRNGQIDLLKFTPGELFARLQAFYPKYKCEVVSKSDKWSIDEYIQYLGGQQQKQLYYLESDSFQVEKLKQATSMYDWSFFKKNVPAILARYRKAAADENLCVLVNQYASFSIDYRFSGGCNLLNNRNASDELLKKRNEAWMQQLPALLEKNNCFVAVGIAHLQSNCGIIVQLRKLGYMIEPVKMK